LQNPGTAETTGLEIDLTAQLADGLVLTASGGAYHYSLSNGGLVGGDRRPFAPDYTASLVADYQRPLTPAITGIATLGYRHRSGGRVPAIGWIDMDSYNLIDAQIGIRVGKMQLAGFVRNALDDDYVVGNYGPAAGQVRYIGLAESISARALLRDPGTVFGARITVIF
jgi:outer membrane receptor protein involved in Fe transport